MSFLAGLGPKIKAKYADAVKDQDGGVVFTESDVIELDDEEYQIPVSTPCPAQRLLWSLTCLTTRWLQFELRYCPGLAKKPTSTPKDDSETDKPRDVFAPPYQSLLYVAEDTVKEDADDEGEQFVVLVSEPSRSDLDGCQRPHPGLLRNRATDLDPDTAAEQVLRDAETLPARHQGVCAPDEPAHPAPTHGDLCHPQAALGPREA